MKTKRLTPMDANWLHIESHETPMHVGGLLTFRIPDDAPDDFIPRMMAHFRGYPGAHPPWNQRLKSSRLKTPVHHWVFEDSIDLEYHVRHSALPSPGGERELGILASRLHSHPLDFRRPPWEIHVIEGLENNRFAIYLKMHHSLIDGVSGMRLLARALATDPDDLARPPLWANPASKSKSGRRERETTSPGQMLGGALRAVGKQINVTRQLAGVTREMANAWRDKRDPMGLPFDAPKSILNGRIGGQRRYATQLYSVTRLKSVAKAADCTLNDIMLAICATALRHYLLEFDALPDKALTAGIPVSVRPADDQETGNAISFIIASLATDIADPEQRLKTISASTKRAKDCLKRMSADAISQYTIALLAPYVGSLVTGMAGRIRPPFNVTISNVPGPAEDLYIRGARMEAFYPTSLVTHGQALNITCHGYADTLGFGFIGCRDTLPHMQKLAVYTGEALDELETLYGRGKRKAKKASN